MKKRSVAGVILYPFVTFGLYSLVWLVMTKNEMNRQGADIPTAWLLIIPIINIWWMWKYAVGVEQVTTGKVSAPLAFIILYLIGSIGQAIIQDSFNKVVEITPDSAPIQPPIISQMS